MLGERRKKSGEIKLERNFNFYMGSLERKMVLQTLPGKNLR